MAEKNLNHHSNEIVKKLDDVFKNAPHLQSSTRQSLANIAPWIALIFGALSIFVGLGAIGLSPLALLGGINASASVLITGVISILSGVLMLMAYPKLNKREFRGWELILWSDLLSVVYAVLSLSFLSLIFIAFGLYLLFEIKGLYK
jgi:uncharacterized membrane protein HdeD (DUF308 family)